MLKAKKGFTIVEVIVVITVVGILTTIGIIAFNKYRTDARDSQRKAQLTAISQALEKYYGLNGEYPGCAAMTASPSTISSSTLVGVDTTLFVAPGSSLSTSMTCSTPSTSDYFGYIGTGSSCASGSACESYVLQYKSETSGSIATIYGTSSAGIVTAGLMLNLDAGNTSSYPGSGNVWYDISGNNRNFTWSPSASFVSGSPSYFNTLGYGATGPASNSFGISNSTGYTVFMASYQNALAASISFKWYTSNGTGYGARGIAGHISYSDGIIYFDQGGCCATDTRTSVAMLRSTGYWNIHALRSNAVNERSIWQNGVNTASNTATPAGLNLNSTAATIATASDEIGATWNARISQLIVYNRALTDTEMAQNYNALKSRYGL